MNPQSEYSGLEAFAAALDFLEVEFTGSTEILGVCDGDVGNPTRKRGNRTNRPSISSLTRQVTISIVHATSISARTEVRKACESLEIHASISTPIAIALSVPTSHLPLLAINKERRAQCQMERVSRGVTKLAQSNSRFLALSNNLVDHISCHVRQPEIPPRVTVG